jgi:TolB-like protein
VDNNDNSNNGKQTHNGPDNKRPVRKTARNSDLSYLVLGEVRSVTYRIISTRQLVSCTYGNKRTVFLTLIFIVFVMFFHISVHGQATEG